MPGYFGSDPEGFLEELVTCHYVLYQIFIDGAGLVTSYPTSIDEFEPIFLDELLEDSLHGLILFVPPLLEKPDFCMRKSFIRVVPQMLCHICQNAINRTVEVL